MPRTLSASVLTAIAAQVKWPVWFAELEFTSGFVRSWTGTASTTWNSQTWTPVGNLGGISPLRNTDDLRADNITLSLSGIDSDQLALALGSVRQGKSCKVWLGFLDSAYALIADPVLIFAGLMDVPLIEEGAVTSTITVSAENRLARLRRICPRRYTDEDQRLDYPLDAGFEYVLALAAGENRLGGILNNVQSPGPRPPRSL